MVFTLIVFLLIVVFMAFFIGKNLVNTCTLWLFKTYTDIPAAVLVLIAFGAGIVFSLLLLMISKFKKSVSSTSVEEVESKKEKSRKRDKTEKKLKKLQKKNKGVAVNTSEDSSVTVIDADK